jgi:hypothetical protein
MRHVLEEIRKEAGETTLDEIEERTLSFMVNRLPLGPSDPELLLAVLIGRHRRGKLIDREDGELLLELKRHAGRDDVVRFLGIVLPSSVPRGTYVPLEDIEERTIESIARRLGSRFLSPLHLLVIAIGRHQRALRTKDDQVILANLKNRFAYIPDVTRFLEMVKL